MDTDAYCPLLRVRRQNIGTKLYGYVLAKRYTSYFAAQNSFLVESCASMDASGGWQVAPVGLN
jgi:hypothetical protein